jgi:hypothetical protein
MDGARDVLHGIPLKARGTDGQLNNIEKEVKTGIFVPGKAMTDLERAGFKGLKAGWEYL